TDPTAQPSSPSGSRRGEVTPEPLLDPLDEDVDASSSSSPPPPSPTPPEEVPPSVGPGSTGPASGGAVVPPVIVTVRVVFVTPSPVFATPSVDMPATQSFIVPFVAGATNVN